MSCALVLPNVSASHNTFGSSDTLKNAAQAIVCSKPLLKKVAAAVDGKLPTHPSIVRIKDVTDATSMKLFDFVKPNDIQVLFKPKKGFYVTDINPSEHVVIAARGYAADKYEKILKSIGLGLCKELTSAKIEKMFVDLMFHDLSINRFEIVVYAKPEWDSTRLEKLALAYTERRVISKILVAKSPITNIATLSINKKGKIEKHNELWAFNPDLM